MITVAEAWQRITAAMPARTEVRVAVDAAHGAILAQAVAAERDQPPFDRVMMDGIAIAAGDSTRRRWTVTDTQAAGADTATLASPAHCIEIMTGAALPRGADTVIPVEQLEIRDGQATLQAQARYETGQFVHGRGTDYRRGTLLLHPGMRLRGPETAVLASSGRAEVAVAEPPAIAIFGVGDELVDPGAPIGATQIRRSNDLAIAALLADHGYRDTRCERLGDDPQQLRERLATALSSYPVVTLTGGVSMGKFDYIPAILDELGVEIVLHKVAQKPGKPMWFGRRDRVVVFALPGNPVSALVCARRYVVPALDHAAGATPLYESVGLASDVNPPAGLTAFVPVVIGDDGRAHCRATNTSGDFNALAATTGFVEVDAPSPARSRVRLWRW